MRFANVAVLDAPSNLGLRRTIIDMLGVHFAITPEHEDLLLAAVDEGDPDAVEALLEEIEEGWDDEALKVDTDKAWDAIHRCLTDGTLDPDGGEYPLSHAVLGGRHLHEDYYVVYLSYTLDSLVDLTAFYDRAAAAARAVVFTAT